MGPGSSWPATRPSLLLRIRDAQDHEAWRAFVDIYTPLLYRYCRKCGLQDADAQDVTQELMSKVRRFEYQPERGRFRSWLGTVTAREIQRVRRKSGRERAAGENEREFDPQGPDELDWDRISRAHLLEAAINRVRPEFSDVTWRAYQLLWEDNRDPTSVAEELERPVGWVYKAKSQILKRLKEEVLYLAEDMALFVTA